METARAREIAKYSGTAAALVLLAVYPGFFLYHSIAGIYGMPLYVGGWASWCNLIGTVVLMPIVSHAAMVYGVLRFHAPTLALFALVATYATFYAVFGNDWQRNPTMFVESGKLLIGWACVYAIGCLMTASQQFRRALWLAFAVMSLVSLGWMDPSSLSFVVERRESAVPGVSDYQGFATAFLVVAILALAVTPKPVAQVAILSVSAVVMFLLSSRAELLAFLLAASTWAVFCLAHRRYLASVLGLAFVGAIQGGLMFLPALLADTVATDQRSAPAIASGRKPAQGTAGHEMHAPSGNPRQSELLSMLASDSVAQRLKLQRAGIEGIRKSPIIGDYGGQIRDYGAFGYYVHNALSTWQQYGLLGFVLYVGLTLWALAVAAFEVVWRRTTDPLWLATLFVAGTSLAMIVLAKPVYWPVPALAWGLLVSQLIRRRVARQAAQV